MNKEEILNFLRPYLGRRKNCVVCNSDEFQVWAALDYLKALKCNKCGMISVNPHITMEGLYQFYQLYMNHRAEDEELTRQRQIMYDVDRDWLELFINRGKILDIGCSSGKFLACFNPDRWHRFGVEIAKDAVNEAQKNFKMEVLQGDILTMEIPERFDVVAFRGVLEHFPDPKLCLERVVNLLKDNGYIYITATPAGNSFAFDVYREKWAIFTPWEHLHFFSLRHLDMLINPLGLKRVSFSYQYEETPYANPESDFKKIQEDILEKKLGQWDQVEKSVPFPGSMLTALWRK